MAVVCTIVHVCVQSTLEVVLVYLRELFTIQPTRSTRSSSCLTLSQPPVTSHLMFSNRAISITAPRLWNDLPSELLTIPFLYLHNTSSSASSIRPPGPSTQNENVISSNTPTLTHLIIHLLHLNDTHLNSYSVPGGILEIRPELLLTPPWKLPFEEL